MSPIVIPPFNIFLSFLPLLLVIFIFVKWSMEWKELLIATTRMLVQLIGVGYVLTFIFRQNNLLWTSLIITFMLLMSGWISLRSIKNSRRKNYWKAIAALLFGSTPVLLWVTGIVIPGTTWSEPTFLIPLAGIVYANTMNTIGVAAERFQSEVRNNNKTGAKKSAFTAAFIPHINMLMAVGLVSLPGLMTGQILSGVDPLIAVRYQVVVMTLVESSSGLSTALYLYLAEKY